MFVLLIARGYPSKKNPLLGIFEYDQAKALRDLGHKIIYASIDLRSVRRWRKWGVSRSNRDGLEIYDFSFPLGRVPWVFLYFFGKKGLLRLYKIITKENGRPDILHAHFTDIGAIASVLKKKYGLPLVITEHNSVMHKKMLGSRDFSVGQIAYGNADKIIAVSRSLSKMITHHFGVDSVVVHNIADVSSFALHNKIRTNKFTFISVGSLIYGKGHDILIEAFRQADFNENVCLHIIGEGVLKSELQKKIDITGLGEQIILKGQMTRKEIGQIMQQGDAFVLASRAETFGVVYIEALLAGLPIIATACGGPEDYIDEDNGILIPVDNVELLKRALIYMYENRTKYDGVQISQKCRSVFSPDVIGERVSRVYNEVLNSYHIDHK